MGMEEDSTCLKIIGMDRSTYTQKVEPHKFVSLVTNLDSGMT